MKALTPVEVAALLGISRQAVCEACRKKRLRAQFISGRWLISRRAVKAFEAKRATHSRQAKGATINAI